MAAPYHCEDCAFETDSAPALRTHRTVKHLGAPRVTIRERWRRLTAAVLGAEELDDEVAQLRRRFNESLEGWPW